ncbi:MAG: ABC transporter ATP-binding protein [Candidatus Eisenbacteria bacterium]|nr:ABC transporter ATP-binding protein [Candidatus Eisenbacteria bacterium]MCC7143288.1 ABC transporter ATP-binding protein [Candidatus Eisenbacteria bacterium]
MLEVTNLDVRYGAIHAIRGVSLSVPEGMVVTLIGANGAGKTTILRTLSGLLRATGGGVRFLGDEITGLPSHQIVKRGLVHIPEGRIVFANMSVLENLELGAYLRRDREVKSDLERVFVLFPRLKERIHQSAGTLSGGEQQMLAIGRGLMSRPRFLLMDEPSLGLAPLLVQGIFEIVREIHRQGTTILLVEQNAHMALQVADFAYVLESGHIVMSGPAAEIAQDPRVRDAYLGGA